MTLMLAVVLPALPVTLVIVPVSVSLPSVMVIHPMAMSNSMMSELGELIVPNGPLVFQMVIPLLSDTQSVVLFTVTLPLHWLKTGVILLPEQLKLTLPACAAGTKLANASKHSRGNQERVISLSVFTVSSSASARYNTLIAIANGVPKFGS